MKTIETVVIAVASAGLIYGGVKADDITKMPSLVAGAFVGIEAIITFIQALTTKKD